LVSAGAPVLVPFFDLSTVECDDGGLQRFGYGMEVSLSAGSCPPLRGVVGEGEAVAGEERGERAAGQGWTTAGLRAAGEQLLRACGRVGGEEADRFAQDGDRAARMVAAMKATNWFHQAGIVVIRPVAAAAYRNGRSGSAWMQRPHKPCPAFRRCCPHSRQVVVLGGFGGRAALAQPAQIPSGVRCRS
jgi:hypothetical protein